MHNIGVDTKVCSDAVCGYYNDHYCDIYKGTPMKERIGQCGARSGGCPVPHICPLKNLHVVMSRWTGDFKCPCQFPFEPPFQEDR